MVMSAQPIFDALRAIRAENKHILYMSPRGRMLDQPMIEQMAREEELVILCGHYEGVDQRVLDTWNMEEISIGDYILTGGELPAMVLIDSVARFIRRYSARREPRPRSRFIRACWNSTSTPNRRTMRAWKYRRCSVTEIIS